jgi:hypothetical protein
VLPDCIGKKLVRGEGLDRRRIAHVVT